MIGQDLHFRPAARSIDEDQLCHWIAFGDMDGREVLRLSQDQIDRVPYQSVSTRPLSTSNGGTRLIGERNSVSMPAPVRQM